MRGAKGPTEKESDRFKEIENLEERETRGSGYSLRDNMGVDPLRLIYAQQ